MLFKTHFKNITAKFFPFHSKNYSFLKKKRVVHMLNFVCCVKSGDWEMLWWIMKWFCFSCCILLGTSSQSKDAAAAGFFHAFSPEQESGDTEGWEWGSGFSSSHVLHSFPGDSPVVSESPEHVVNCTQRFWLPPAPICWENAVGPEEFAKCRVLILQNRAALQALFISSGVEEGGSSYNHKAKEEIQGIHSEHQKMEDTVKTVEMVFVSLAEKRKEGTEQAVLTR